MVHGFKSLTIKQLSAIVAATSIVVASGVIAAIVIVTSSPNESTSEKTTRQEEVTETEVIDFKTIEKEDASKNIDVTEVQQEGKNGERTITYLVTYDSDGNEINREKIADEVTIEPIDEIVAKGTKKTSVATTQQPPTSTNNSQQAQPDKCKTMLVGQGRPTTCPTQTRVEFTALGGWENHIRSTYSSFKDMEPAKSCSGDVCTYTRSVSASGLCYATIHMDLDKMEITYAEWDDSRTSTCDDVRNEHPPLPSLQYLTQYLRSIAK